MHSGSGTSSCNTSNSEHAEARNGNPRTGNDSDENSRKKRVLIVEDHRTLRQSLRLYFEFKGYAVASAEGYEKALEKAAACPPDVIVCDRQLDDVRDGIDVARALQRRYGSDVVFVSGTSMDELRAETSDLDVIAYLKKPVLPHRIERAVRSAGVLDDANDAE